LQDIKDKHADQIELRENSVTKPSYKKKKKNKNTNKKKKKKQKKKQK